MNPVFPDSVLIQEIFSILFMSAIFALPIFLIIFLFRISKKLDRLSEQISKNQE
jgi:hypothetical protein